MTAGQPRVLFIYFTYSQQTLKVVEAMSDVLRTRGCDVVQARIEFTDPRWAGRFSRFPMLRPFLNIFGMVPAQFRHATGTISVPETVNAGDYDLICIGSPSWWLNPCMPIRSFLESDQARTVLAGKPFAAVIVCHRYWKNNLRTVKTLGLKQGGKFLDGIWFIAAGGPINSMMAFFSFVSTGVIQDRYFGFKIPPAGLQPSYLGQAQTFAAALADSLPAPVAIGAAPQ